MDGFSTIVENSLIAVNSDGKEIKIAEIEPLNYCFDYYRNKLYTLEYDYETKKYTFSYIDLTQGNGNYTVIPFAETVVNYGEISSIRVIEDNIYYVYSKKDDTHNVRFFNMNTGISYNTEMFLNSETQLYKMEAENDYLIYTNDKDKICLTNLQNENTNIIAENSIMILYYNNKIIYWTTTKDNLGNDMQIKFEQYEYDILTNNRTKISNELEFSMSAGQFYVIPYKNGYIYSDKNSVYMYSDGKIKEIYRVNEDSIITYTQLLNSNKLKVGIFESGTVMIDLNTNAVEYIEEKENDIIYYYQIGNIYYL